MRSIWEMKREEGGGDFQGKWKDSCPIIKMGDRLGDRLEEEEERNY